MCHHQLSRASLALCARRNKRRPRRIFPETSFEAPQNLSHASLALCACCSFLPACSCVALFPPPVTGVHPGTPPPFPALRSPLPPPPPRSPSVPSHPTCRLALWLCEAEWRHEGNQPINQSTSRATSPRRGGLLRHLHDGEEGRKKARIPANLIRLCVGAEDADDIIAELKSALAA